MAKLPLNDINSRYGSVGALNANFEEIQQAFENTLSRDGTGPNFMEAPLDMNGNDILNASNLSVNSLSINGQLVVPTGTAVTTLPGQAGQAGRYLFTNGSAASWRLLEWTPAGASPRTVQAKLRDVVSVNDFGADPTGVAGSATAIQAALNSGARYVEARGNYLIDADLLLPDEVIFDCRGSILRASANNRTLIKSTGMPSSYLSQIWGGVWDGNGRTGVIGMDLSNMRIGAGVFSPVWRDMAVGLISRNGCFGMVIDNPGSLRVPAPIQVLANASTMVIRNPSLDNSSGVGGNDTGIGIDIRFGAGDNIGVRVEGGYVQGFASGILDAGIKTVVENVYFELCSVADVNAVAARASHYKTNTHYGPSGPAGYRLRNNDAVIIDDPTMASGARTRLFDADGTNTNCVARMAGSNASLNAPLGITTGLMLTDYTTFYTATDASGAGLIFTANRQGYRSGHGLRVTIDVDITYPTTSSTANAAITLPVPARAGALVSGACGFTDYGGFVGIAGSGSTINFFSAAGGNLTNANLSGRRLQFALSYVVQ